METWQKKSDTMYFQRKEESRTDHICKHKFFDFLHDGKMVRPQKESTVLVQQKGSVAAYVQHSCNMNKRDQQCKNIFTV